MVVFKYIREVRAKQSFASNGVPKEPCMQQAGTLGTSIELDPEGTPLE